VRVGGVLFFLVFFSHYIPVLQEDAVAFLITLIVLLLFRDLGSSFFEAVDDRIENARISLGDRIRKMRKTPLAVKSKLKQSDDSSFDLVFKVEKLHTKIQENVVDIDTNQSELKTTKTLNSELASLNRNYSSFEHFFRTQLRLQIARALRKHVGTGN